MEEPARTDPPATPVVGTSYLVASNAVGEWAGHDGALAAFTPGGWRHVAPTDGLIVLEKASGTTLRYRSGAWEQVLGSRQAAIPDATGGMTVDAESRAAISAILSALTGARAYSGLGYRSGRALFAGGFDFTDPARGDPQGDEGEGRDDE